MGAVDNPARKGTDVTLVCFVKPRCLYVTNLDGLALGVVTTKKGLPEGQGRDFSLVRDAPLSFTSQGWVASLWELFQNGVLPEGQGCDLSLIRESPMSLRDWSGWPILGSC